MTTKKIKEMLDACYQAKRIREMLPPLPQGVMPSYIQYLDIIEKLEKQGIILAFITLEKKLLSDIITTPSVEGDFSRALKESALCVFFITNEWGTV